MKTRPPWALDTHTMREVLIVLAQHHNKTVVFHDEDIAFTDARTNVIYIPKPQWTWTEDEILHWYGKAYHEIGHHSEGNREIMDYCTALPVDMGSFLGRVVNILSDFVNDQQWKGKWPGANRAVESLQVSCADAPETTIKQSYEDACKDPRSKCLFELFSWIYGQRVLFHPMMLGPAQKWYKIVPQAHLRKFDPRLWALRDGKSVVDLAEDILRMYGLEDEIKEGKKPCKEGPKNKGKKGKGAGKEGEGEGEGDTGEPTDGIPEKLKGMIGKLLGDDHAKTKDAENPEREEAFKSKKGGAGARKSGVYVPHKGYAIIDMRKVK